MIDANEDPVRAANERAAEIAARRAERPAQVGRRSGGTLATLPSAPRPVPVAAPEPVGETIQMETPAPVPASDAGTGGLTQIVIAAVIVVVLFFVWVAERRSRRGGE